MVSIPGFMALLGVFMEYSQTHGSQNSVPELLLKYVVDIRRTSQSTYKEDILEIISVSASRYRASNLPLALSLLHRALVFAGY